GGKRKWGAPAASGQPLQLPPFLGRGSLQSACGKHRVDGALQIASGKWSQREPAAARADGRRQSAWFGGNQQKKRARRWLLQRLQERVGRVYVELIGAVHDDDAPGMLAARQSQKRPEPAHLVNGNGGRHHLV